MKRQPTSAQLSAISGQLSLAPISEYFDFAQQPSVCCEAESELKVKKQKVKIKKLIINITE